MWYACYTLTSFDNIYLHCMMLTIHNKAIMWPMFK